MSLGLFQRKANNGRPDGRFAFDFTFSEDSTVIDRGDVRDVDAFVNELTQREQVRIFLEERQDKAALTSEIAEFLTNASPKGRAVSEGAVRTILARYPKDFQRLALGRIGLALPVRAEE